MATLTVSNTKSVLNGMNEADLKFYNDTNINNTNGIFTDQLKSPKTFKQSLLNFEFPKLTNSEKIEYDSNCENAVLNKECKSEENEKKLELNCVSFESNELKCDLSKSPRSLKQPTIISALSPVNVDFKKPVRSRRPRLTKRSQSTRRNRSVDNSKESMSKAVSVSPKKSTKLKEDINLKTEGSKHQTQLTVFGIRRTARQYAKDLEHERQLNYIECLKNCVESGMKMVETETKGRGVIATRTFYENEFVVEYAGELVSEKVAKIREAEYKKDSNIGSYMFFFVHAGQRYCVDATKETDRLGRLINHSRLNPNCTVRVIALDGVPRLALFTRKSICPGEEFLYDYGDRDKETLEAHPWLKTT